jgi:hypothetical protein
MNRREAIQRFSIIIGGSILGADSLLAKNIDWDKIEDEASGSKGIGIFTKAQIKLMNEIAETIIPTTNTPGAKAAKTGEFIAVIVSDVYAPDKQQLFMEGLVKLDEGCQKRNGKAFMKCKAEARHDYLVELDKEQKAFEKTKKKEEPHHYFKVMKDLVTWGYFTSEIGATQALRYVAVPGAYKTIDYKKGDKAWG